jgi:hypothetical protein
VFASLRPWLAFREPALATLAYSGPPDAADASGVPALIDLTVRGVTRRATPCLPGPAGLAVLDFSRPDARGPDARDRDVTSNDLARGRLLRLTVRGYGEAQQQTARLKELIMAWDAASRPGTGRLRIDAYPSGVMPPDGGGVPQPDTGGVPHPDTGGIMHLTLHATFVMSWSGA